MNTNNDKSALAPASKGTLEFVNVVKDYGTGEAAVKGSRSVLKTATW